jgi:hypothetical protein
MYKTCLLITTLDGALVAATKYKYHAACMLFCTEKRTTLTKPFSVVSALQDTKLCCVCIDSTSVAPTTAMSIIFVRGNKNIQSLGSLLCHICVSRNTSLLDSCQRKHTTVMTPLGVYTFPYKGKVVPVLN